MGEASLGIGQLSGQVFHGFGIGSIDQRIVPNRIVEQFEDVVLDLGADQLE